MFGSLSAIRFGGGAKKTAALKFKQHFYQYPAASINIVTSHESQAMREAAKQAGAFAYILRENLLDLRGLISQIVSVSGRVNSDWNRSHQRMS